MIAPSAERSFTENEKVTFESAKIERALRFGLR
jgi:hypothetical protein